MRFRLRQFRDANGFTQEQVAEMLDISVSLYNGLENGKRRMNADYIEGAARIYHVRPSDLIDEDPETVAVPGKVGAGAQVYAIDDHAKGEGLYRVACPPQLSPHGIVAVEVEGDSMLPVYAPGDVLFYTRDTVGVPTEALGRICVAEDDQGRTWVKQVKLGSAPGCFNLVSINPFIGTNMHDVALNWAAPVRLHLPKDLVRKI
ncbi:XRE family transcriptional regulator [Frigidibacter sp. MR17.24]|uniref:XRE family transcriptional regulator n=1 Tax=Frigidibacter sp. MR17.24 TaxID=3127345 RepID=UPI0030131B5C